MKAQIASLTGSPLWGLSVEDVLAKWNQMGMEVIQDFRPDTPYGLGPRTVYMETPSDRKIIWIPSYGGVAGKDWLYDETDQKVFWILWKADVKVLIIGGTSGIADWRSTGSKVQPGDIVFPWSFRTNPHHRGLRGTEHEIAWPHRDLLLDEPFCSGLVQSLYDTALPYVQEGILHGIHRPEDVRVALIVPDGITYETTYDILKWNAINKMISEMQLGLPPVVTLHGDCVNPVLARLLGMHVAYYHMVANVAQGLPMESRIVDSLYPLYVDNFAKVAVPMEFSLMQNLPIPDGTLCSCITSVHTAPEVFAKSMTVGG